MATMYDPPHLGELIRESIEAEGWTVTGTAERLGVSRVALSRVLNGHADDPRHAAVGRLIRPLPVMQRSASAPCRWPSASVT